jgi:hypothetical protein
MSANPDSMHLVKPRQLFIRGITREGRVFRPSDWSERLAGLMSHYRPTDAGRQAAHLGYSPYCVPTIVDGVRCLVVSESLRDIEPMAFDFLMNFARDNHLDVIDACLTDDAAEGSAEALGLARDALQKAFRAG